MDERAALDLLSNTLAHAGDDAAVIDGTAITTDMLHETTDFPAGTTRYTAGWRSVGASLSDLAAMGATPTAAVAAYADTAFDAAALTDFVTGARDVCAAVDAEYVGGDLDTHSEFTVATTAIGDVIDPVFRSGATPGDRVVVTGTFGRSAAALTLFVRAADRAAETDVDPASDTAADPTADALCDRANDLFRFTPRVAEGQALATSATAMMDSSDGLARSLHQLAVASDCGIDLDREAVPVDSAVLDAFDTAAEQWKATAFFGEDFELVATVPETALDRAIAASPTPLSVIGRVVDTEEGLTVDGEPLADRGYTH